MALLLCLGLTAALARGCLHCHGNFSEKFSFYRHHVNLKSWWVGDIPVSGLLLSDWSQDTMKELHLAIPAEITHRPPSPASSPGEAEPSGERRVPEDGSAVPGEDVFPRVLPQRAASHLSGAGAPHPECNHRKHLPVRDHLLYQLHGLARRLLWLQLRVIGTVGNSCAGPPPVHVSWGPWAQGGDLPLHACRSDSNPAVVVEISGTSKSPVPKPSMTCIRGGVLMCPCGQDDHTRTTPAFLMSPSFTCLEPPHLANLTLENASECLTQH
ncbi:izumo sperm-egg fusion protein 4 isoform X3 [Lynx rufus]|uniref:izumo sperm-egg fusion protein 4 isoform X3 n=1 Tax=Lynx rufus TaxID=61384 RepID=UPI001F12790D|nr:izumo sperm-egg fusion protein 4 isoform X3 [Lynx rufus]